MIPTPWTKRFVVRWAPNLAYYEKSTAVLRELEQREMLRTFRVDETSTAARLGDPYHYVTFGPRGMTVGLLGPHAERDRVKTAVELVFDALAPTRLTRPVVSTQWLGALDQAYDEAKTTALTQLLGDLGRYKDFAFLIEGGTEDPQTDYVLELGIVEGAELPQRLSREHGRIGQPEPEAPPTLWSPEALPSVAFFCDSQWELLEHLSDSSPEGLFQLWDATINTGVQLLSKVLDRMLPEAP